MSILSTVQWLFDFKQFDWFGGHWLSAHILVIDYIWKTPGKLKFCGEKLKWLKVKTLDSLPSQK